MLQLSQASKVHTNCLKIGPDRLCSGIDCRLECLERIIGAFDNCHSPNWDNGRCDCLRDEAQGQDRETKELHDAILTELFGLNECKNILFKVERRWKSLPVTKHRKKGYMQELSFILCLYQLHGVNVPPGRKLLSQYGISLSGISMVHTELKMPANADLKGNNLTFTQDSRDTPLD
jgi:hypothetical protein